MRYIWNSLYPVSVQSGMGCVIVEGDTLALFTALKNSPRNIVSGGIPTTYKVYEFSYFTQFFIVLCHFVEFLKT